MTTTSRRTRLTAYHHPDHGSHRNTEPTGIMVSPVAVRVLAE